MKKLLTLLIFLPLSKLPLIVTILVLAWLMAVCAECGATVAPCSSAGSPGGGVCYVANAGSDSNNGTIGNPWLTIAKVNSYTYTSDDQILFNRGDTWLEQLRVPSSGTSGHPITFGAYGTGAAPTIDGKYVTALSWTYRGSGTDIGGLFVSGLEAETNAFTTEWTSKVESNSNAFTVTTAQKAFGSKAGLLTFAGTGYASYVYKTISAQGDIDVRCYFKTDGMAFASGVNGIEVMDLYGGGGASLQARVGIKSMSSTNIKGLYFIVGATTIYAGSSGELGDSNWHYIEMHWKAGSGTGGGQVWLDGSSKGSNFTLTTTGTVDTIRLGGIAGFGAVPNAASTLYFDGIKVDTSYIGSNPYIGTNIWSATLAASAVNYCLFDGIAGQKQTSTAALAAARDFYQSSNVFYTYSATSPSSAYTAVNPIVPAGIDGNSKNYLQIQDICIRNYDSFGVKLNSSTGSVVNYCSVEGGLTYGTTYGIMLQSSTSCAINNCDVFKNYVNIIGSGTGNTVKNCKIFGGWSWGLQDTAAGGVGINYSYNEFYADGMGDGNGEALSNAGNISGGTDGGNNITDYSWPYVLNPNKYPTMPISLSIDDPGGVSTGDGSYIDDVVTQFNSRGDKVSVAIVTGGLYVDAGFITKMQAWYTGGHDICSHSWSHRYWTSQLSAFNIQYTGNGSACTMSISGNTLTTSITGQSDGSANLSIDLTNSSYDNFTKLVAYINGSTSYSCTIVNQNFPSQGLTHSVSLADVTAQAIKASPYAAQCDKSRLVTDELASSKAMLQGDLPGYSIYTYVWPNNESDTTTEALAISAGFSGSRGTHATWSVAETLEAGVSVYGLGCYNISTLTGSTSAQFAARIKMAEFFSALWGFPVNLYWHPGDITATEAGYALDGVKAISTHKTLTEMIQWLRAQTNTTAKHYALAGNGVLDFHLQPSSPAIYSGTSVGLTTDFGGLPVPIPGAPGPSIGAYEPWTTGQRHIF